MISSVTNTKYLGEDSAYFCKGSMQSVYRIKINRNYKPYSVHSII